MKFSKQCSGSEAFQDQDGDTITAVFAGIVCVSIPNTIKKIQDGSMSANAFKESADTLTTIDFSGASNLISIGSCAFYNCAEITTFDLSKCTSLSSIGWGAFMKCSKANCFILPNNTLSAIEGSTFAECTSLVSIIIPSSVTIIKDGYPDERGAFLSCTSLDTVLFYNDSLLTYIGGKTFLSSSLKYITLPKTLSTIDAYAFRICQKLQSINVQEGSTFFKSYNGILINKDNALVYFPQCASTSDTAIIPNFVVSCNQFSFIGVSSYKFLEIPPSVTSLSGKAFYNFASLQRVTVPATVTVLSDWLFAYCYNLVNITFLNKPTVIPVFFCAYCEFLTEFTIPKGVTTLSDSAFDHCKRLKIVYAPNTLTKFGSGIFTNCPSDLKLIFEENSPVKYIDEYLYNSDFTQLIVYLGSKTEVTIISSVQIICAGAFQNRGLITSVKYENIENITFIGNYAFSSCTGLITVDLPSKLTIISNYLFQYSSIQTITIPTQVKTIGVRSFLQCTNLKTVTFPNTLNLIKEAAFQSCSLLSNIVLPNNLRTINLDAFSNCQALNTLKLPAALSSIGFNTFAGSGIETFSFDSGFSMKTLPELAFSRCSKLNSISIPQCVEEISSNAFYMCNMLARVTIGSSVSTIGNYAFSSCETLNEVIIGDNTVLQTINYLCFDSCPKLERFVVDGNNNFAFDDCILFNRAKTEILLFLRATNPESIIIVSTVHTINANSFSYCDSLRNVTFIGAGIETIGIGAFQSCKSLQTINFPSSLIYIGFNAFNLCDLRTISLSLTNITSLRENVFSNNVHLSRIVLPLKLLSVSSNSFTSIHPTATVFYFGENIITNPAGLNSRSKVICFENYKSDVFLGLHVVSNFHAICSRRPLHIINNRHARSAALISGFLFMHA